MTRDVQPGRLSASRVIHVTLCASFVALAGAAHLVPMARPAARGSAAMLLHLAWAVVMLAAWALGQQLPRSQQRLTLLAGALAILVVAPVSVADVHDVQRYLWDGAVLGAGLDPYRLAPSSPEVAPLRALWPTPAEHVAYPTLYPPGALALFGLATGVGPAWAPWAWKALVTISALGALWWGARALDELGRSQHLPLLAFSPLLLMEAATGAHLDLIVALAVAAGLSFMVRGRPILAGIALGAGALLKLLPALALLPILASVPRRLAIRVLAGSAFVVVAGYLAAAAWGLQPLGSLPIFFARWRFGAPAFSALASLAGDERALVIAPIASGVALTHILRGKKPDWQGAVALVMAVPLLGSPVVFPWYLAPLVPAVALAPSAFLLAWQSALPLTYEVVDRFESAGIWEPAAWPLWTIGIASLAGLFIDLARRTAPFQPATAGFVSPAASPPKDMNDDER